MKRFILDSSRPDPEVEEEAFAYLLRKRGLSSKELCQMLLTALLQEAVQDYCEGGSYLAATKLELASEVVGMESFEESDLEKWVQSCRNFASYPKGVIEWEGWYANRNGDVISREVLERAFEDFLDDG